MVVGGLQRANAFFTSVTSTNSPVTDSDRRFKRNITEITSSLDVVQQLTGVQYMFKADEFPEKQFSNSLQLGFIAQDVEKVLPEIVTTQDDGFKAIAYSALTPVLSNAIKELRAQFDAQLKTQEQQFASQQTLLAEATKQFGLQQVAQQAAHESAVALLAAKIEDLEAVYLQSASKIEGLQSEITRLQQ